ncbi:GntR family transcriptional regulator [Corynebacterium sp. L4756]|uniref:GntR family transcriptional regulator n=1 Tax=unclassified Corynebacterium TaxID=2624378 RepID=UPI00374CD373
MSLPKLNSNTRVSDRAFEALYQAIMSGELDAGQRLQVRELAESLGTSMMPVREALNRLEEFGLVETLPYKGAVVKSFTLEELLEIYSLRKVLESEAIVRGVAHVDAQCVAELSAQLENIEDALKAHDPARFLDAEEGMLTCVFERAGNQTLMDFIRTLWARSRYYKLVGVKEIFAQDEVALLADEARAFVTAASLKDEAQTLEALHAALKRAEDGIKKQLQASN